MDKTRDIHSIRIAAGIDIVIVAVVLTDRGAGGGVNVAHAILQVLRVGLVDVPDHTLAFFSFSFFSSSQWHQMYER